MKSKQKIQIQIIPSLVNVRKLENLATEKSSEFVKKRTIFFLQCISLRLAIIFFAFITDLYSVLICLIFLTIIFGYIFSKDTWFALVIFLFHS